MVNFVSKKTGGGTGFADRQEDDFEKGYAAGQECG